MTLAISSALSGAYITFIIPKKKKKKVSVKNRTSVIVIVKVIIKPMLTKQ